MMVLLHELIYFSTGLLPFTLEDAGSTEFAFYIREQLSDV